jgi:hypothetical protein
MVFDQEFCDFSMAKQLFGPLYHACIHWYTSQMNRIQQNAYEIGVEYIWRLLIGSMV